MKKKVNKRKKMKYSGKKKNSLRNVKVSGVPLLNFEGDPEVPLLNFEGTGRGGGGVL